MTDKLPIDDLVDLDETWAELAEDWQSQPYQKADISALLKKTKRRNRQSKLLFILDIAVTVLTLLAFCYGRYIAHWHEFTLSYLAIVALGSIGLVGYSYKIRIKAWRLIAQSPDKAIDTAIETCKSSIQYLKLIKYSCYFFIIPVNWYVWQMTIINNKSQLKGIIVSNLILLVIYLWAVKRQRTRKVELNALNASNSI
jgi:hypothetical protein